MQKNRRVREDVEAGEVEADPAIAPVLEEQRKQKPTLHEASLFAAATNPYTWILPR